MLTHAALRADVGATRPETGACAWWWLGQHSFIVKTAAVTMGLDLFLTPIAGRKTPPLLTPDELPALDYVFGSHDHTDHIDRPAWPVIARTQPTCRFVVPSLLLPRLADELSIPRERFIGMDDSSTFRDGGLAIRAIAAAHERLDRDPATGRYPYLGFIIDSGGVTLWHPGDTCRYEGLLPNVAACRPQLAFLPINGRDAERLRAGCIGNMTWQEAADLAGELNLRLAVPAHFDMFEGNTADPRRFADYIAVKYPGTRVIIPNYGTRTECWCGE